MQEIVSPKPPHLASIVEMIRIGLDTKEMCVGVSIFEEHDKHIQHAGKYIWRPSDDHPHLYVDGNRVVNVRYTVNHYPRTQTPSCCEQIVDFIWGRSAVQFVYIKFEIE